MEKQTNGQNGGSISLHTALTQGEHLVDMPKHGQFVGQLLI